LLAQGNGENRKYGWGIDSVAYYWRKIRSLEDWAKPFKGKELRANCLGDMETTGPEDSISLWLIDDDLLPLVVVQLAKSGWRNVQDVRYVRLPEDVVRCSGLAAQQEDEKAPPEPLKGRHYNLHIGTAANLLRFTHDAAAKAECDCFRKAKLPEAICAALAKSYCQLNDFGEALQKLI